MAKKKIMRAFKIDEISAVDRPAQAHARAVLMKRADTSLEDENLVTKGSVLTTNVEGHAHLIYCLEEGGGTTSYSQKVGESDTGHSHPYVITDEGKIIIGESEGHTHDVAAFGKEAPKKNEDGKNFGPGDYAYMPDVTKTDSWKLRLTDTPGGQPHSQSVNAAVTALSKLDLAGEELTAVIHRVSKAWLQTNPGKTQDDLPQVLKTQTKETTMTKEEMDALLAKKDAEVAKANKLAGLNDLEKAHYNTLSDADKDAFLAKSDAERKDVLAKKADADPVIYKSVAGIEYRKSAGEQMIALAKQADESAALAKAEKEKRENAELTKRATETFKNLPGTDESKAALLKSLESIPDEAARKSAIEAVTAGDAAVSAAFARKGAGGGSSTDTSAADQLDTLAKKHAADNKVPYIKAYETVLTTEEGKKLYEQTLTAGK